MRFSVLLPILLVILAACSGREQITSADRRYLFFASEIEHFHIEKYQRKMTPGHLPYIYIKTYTEQYGFRGLYGTILLNPDGGKVKYLCLVNILPTSDQAHELFSRMADEPSPTDFGREETVDPHLYQADESYLYQDDTYFHMVLRSSRVVYTILLDGVMVKETQVRSGLRQKMAYLTHHLNAIH